MMNTGDKAVPRKETKSEGRKRRRKFVDSYTSFAELTAILFDDEENPAVVEDAIRGLYRQASESPNKWQISEFPDALRGLVRLLFKDDLPEIQKNSAWALANLAASHAQKNKVKLASFPQVLQGLVKLLQKDDDPGIQEEAVRAMRNLACDESNNEMISLYPDALATLLKLLSDGDGTPEVQMQSTMAIINLLGNSVATRIEDQLPTGQMNQSMEILAYPDALTEIVKILFHDSNLELQEHAAYGLVDLVENTLVNKEAFMGGNSAGGKGNVEKIADFPEALADLVQLFSDDSLNNCSPPGFHSSSSK